jgi:ZIP family zinc transporter
MVAIVSFDLFPEAIAAGGLLLTSIGTALGAGLISLIDTVLPHTHANPEDRESSRFARTSLLLGIGVALHNLPEGLAIGAAYSSGLAFGATITILIFLHNIPEGMAIAAPLLVSGGSRLRAVTITALAGLPVAIGAMVGAAAASVSPHILTLALGFAGGAMLFIVADELLPGACELAETGHNAGFGLVAGTLAGMILSTWMTGP